MVYTIVIRHFAEGKVVLLLYYGQKAIADLLSSAILPRLKAEFPDAFALGQWVRMEPLGLYPH